MFNALWGRLTSPRNGDYRYLVNLLQKEAEFSESTMLSVLKTIKNVICLIKKKISLNQAIFGTLRSNTTKSKMMKTKRRFLI